MPHPRDPKLSLEVRRVEAPEFRLLVEERFEPIFQRPLPRLPERAEYSLLYQEGNLAGWHFGWMLDPHAYMMTNTAVLPEFRRQHLYSSFAALLIQQLRDRGVIRVISRHNHDNHAILDAKLKLGFLQTGFEDDPILGRLAILELALG